MKRIIFHIPFEIDFNRFSASHLRPVQMIKAFEEIGYQVFQISGNTKERHEKFQQLKSLIGQGKKFDFCYSETSTMPQMLTEKHHLPIAPFLEVKIFKFLRSNDIPIGLFYRDIHWKFEQYKKATGFMKRTLAKFFYLVDLIIYRYLIDVIFLPSLRMKTHLPFFLQKKPYFELPPGHQVVGDIPRTYSGKNSCLYVGGVKPPLYDLSSIEKLNGNVPIKLICRKDEWEEMGSFYKFDKKLNLEVLHVSGENLIQHYLSSDVFLLIWKPNKYLDFAMPMKVFEAIGHQIPIVTKEGTLVSQFVKDYDIGWTYFEDEDLEYLISTLSETYEAKLENVKRISSKHHWKYRAKTVKKILIK